MAKYIIDIPKPCSEDWNQMTPLEKGRHCAVCEKEIYDFSSYTEQELIEQIKKGGKLCGRIPVKFLNIPLDDGLHTSRGFRFNGLVATFVNLLVLTTVTTIHGQESNRTEHFSVDKKQDKSKGEATLYKKRILKGYIVDEENFPLPGCVISILDTKESVETDVNGEFKLIIPDSVENELNIQSTFMGLTTQIINVRDFDTLLKITMVEEVREVEDVVIMVAGEPTIVRMK
ncbi:carboxypeptidase-like regulatory domain-containing protein [Myroides odoratus]|uniref:carboxypeptidase-like regulatory domain-containing protein n=1 Tax=Myroides odoratus TaxID=256 RepID=UPI00333F69AD